MSAAPAQAPVRAHGSRRRAARYAIAIPLDVTVLRCGVPQNIPGRSLNMGESGAALVLAGNVRIGESVGIELRLSPADEPVRAKAVVRHQNPLRCGVEFLRLSSEGEDILRQWACRMGERASHISSTQLLTFEIAQPAMAEHILKQIDIPRSSSNSRRILWLGLATLLLLGLLGWWRWERSWKELESRLPQNQITTKSGPVSVEAGVMEGLLTHKVDPLYPEEARRQNLQGVVVLDAVIGRDGAVVDLRPVSGADLLASAAMESVKWWHYEPYRVDGQATEVATTVMVSFQSN